MVWPRSTALTDATRSVYAILNKNKNATCNNFKDLELQFIEGNQSTEINSLGPNLWISNDCVGAQPWVGLGGHRPTHWGARPSLSELVFSPQNGFIKDRNTSQHPQLFAHMEHFWDLLFQKSLWSYAHPLISAHETWDQQSTCCIYIFVQYNVMTLGL